MWEGRGRWVQFSWVTRAVRSFLFPALTDPVTGEPLCLAERSLPHSAASSRTRADLLGMCSLHGVGACEQGLVHTKALLEQLWWQRPG